MNNSLPTFTYTPFSPGLFYLYISYPDYHADKSNRADGGMIDLNTYIRVMVKSDSVRISIDNDHNMECASRKYCIFTQQVRMMMMMMMMIYISYG